MGRIEKNKKRDKNLQLKCVGFHDFKQERNPLLLQYPFSITINAIKFSLTRSEEIFLFPTTSWSLTQKARQNRAWWFDNSGSLAISLNVVINNPSLGPGSALGEKGKEKNFRRERKNDQREKRTWEVVWWGERVAFPSPQMHRWACLARRYFFYSTPFLAFPPTPTTAEPGPRL